MSLAWLRRLPAIPSQCAVCRAWPAAPVCEACITRFAQPVHRCVRCALPLGAGRDTCGSCLVDPPPLDACHAAVGYGYPWAPLIAQFKFQGLAAWARTFAMLLRSAPWVEHAIDRADVVVPLPLAPARLRERGFNQSLLLARELAPGRAAASLLLRVRATPPQASLDRRARQANVRGAFALEPGRAASLKGRRVVLVDDVMTSGASLFAAAAVLRQAGASHVTGLAFARTDAPA